MHSVALVDVHYNETGWLSLYDSSGSVIMSHEVLGLGKNSAQVLDPQECGVSAIAVSMCGDGAIDDIIFSTQEEVCVSGSENVDTMSCSDSTNSTSETVCIDYSDSVSGFAPVTVTESGVTTGCLGFSDTVSYESCVEVPTTFSEIVCVEDEDCVPVLDREIVEVCDYVTMDAKVEVCHKVYNWVHVDDGSGSGSNGSDDCQSDTGEPKVGDKPWVSGGGTL